MRRIVHPGPPAAQRLETAATTLVPVRGVLPPGDTVMAGTARLLAQAGLRGGMLAFSGGRCEPFCYVLPALSESPAHAAWYSDTFAPREGAAILTATASVGFRDGAPFLHCHGLWDTGEGAPRMGHMLPLDSRVAQPVAVTGFGSADAWFDAVPDAETNFTLFSAQGGGHGPDLLLRVRPNEDVSRTVEAACAQAGIGGGRVFGIGSINEVFFADGRTVPCLATEILIHDGRIAGGRAVLDVSVVDVAGDVHRGVLERGNSPVGVTFELAVVNDDREGAI